MCELAFNAAGERHGICELAFNAAGERHGNGRRTAWYCEPGLNLRNVHHIANKPAGVYACKMKPSKPYLMRVYYTA
jgi:hypothetical protein